MAKAIQLRPDSYTIIGKYGCGFTEACYDIIDKCENHLGKTLKKQFCMFFEDAYEYQIHLLKKTLPKDVLSHFDATTSPCIFHGCALIGDYKSFQHHISNTFDLELNENAADAVDAAEKRRFNHMNTSENTFVRIGLTETDHETYGPHYINLEVFSKELPQSSARFLSLCQGSNEAPSQPGYKGTICSRIQKGDFMQFGKIFSLPSDYPTLNDEHFIYNHEIPGMVGFVGGKTTHTNKTEFYVTLAPMPSFDKNFVVFGRVVEGISYLKKISDKQNPHSLLPTIKLKIQEISIFEKKPTAETLRRQKEESELRPHMETFMSFKNHSEIGNFIESYKADMSERKYVKGPEIVEIKNLANNDDLYLLSELPLSHVHTLSFRDCSFDQPSQTKIFKRHGFFMNVRHWEFFSCELSKEILKTFFINKATKPVESLIVEPRGNGLDIFKILIKWKKLLNMTRFAFIGSRIGKDDLELLLQAPVFHNLVHLDLSHTKFYDDGLSDFLTKFNNKNIRGLYLQSTGISDSAAKLICSNKIFSNLSVLDLSNNFSMSSIVTLISESKHMNHLQELYLRNTQLTIDPLEELLNSHNFSSIRKLDVSNNFTLKDDFCLALLFKPFIRKLEYLNLENTNLTNLGLYSLILNAESGQLKHLTVLDVSNNPAISVSEAWNTLTHNPNQICDDVFKARPCSEEIRDKAEAEFKIKETHFIKSLKTLHMANLSMTADLKKNIEAKYQISVEMEPVICKDYSDYLEHINIPIHEHDSVLAHNAVKSS